MRVSNDLSRAVFYVLIIVVIVVGAEAVMGGALGHTKVYVVVSKSMVPTLQIGDLVVTQSVPYSDIHVGNVIVYIPPDSEGGCSGETIVHRVVAITSTGLITQGDDRITNPTPDEPYRWPPVTPQCVQGEVVAAVPYLGLVSITFPPPWNYLLVVLILLFVFLSEIRLNQRGSDDKGKR